jgi:translation initiation factor 2 subunit 2
MDYKEMLKKARSNLPQYTGAERFEVPKPQVHQSGKLTYIRNFSDMARTLRREPKQIAKYLFKSLAVPGMVKGSELILQGKVGYSMLEQRIQDYVKEFVLCHECGKPDTNISEDSG